MKSKQVINPIAVDIQKLEQSLPAKHKRSHNVVVSVKDLYKDFVGGGRRIPVLKGINITMYSGEFAIIFGPSGCGKSTLLHTILGLEPPTKGSIRLRKRELTEMSQEERTNWRREKLGMVFQQSNWIKAFNVWENVAYPLYLSGMQPDEAKKRAYLVLKEVGLQDWAEHKPTELSGGQQQRVSLARALSTDPWIIVADEPTGNLDSQASTELMELLTRLNREHKRMILMVTHDMSFLPLANRRIAMRDGQIVGDECDV